MILSAVVETFTEARIAEQYSPRTIASYLHVYRRFTIFCSDCDIGAVDQALIRKFFAGLGGLSRKTILCYHTALSSLWRWSIEHDHATHNVIRLALRPRKPILGEIVPYNRDDLASLLVAAAAGDLPFRDRAVILVLLDTGIRASEFIALRFGDLYAQDRKLVVKHGKGNKQRVLRYSEPTGAALAAYLETRKSKKLYAPLFSTENGGAMARHTLRKLLDRLGRRGRVIGVHAHRFRHTFALQFLRNGGNIFTLRSLLGHTTLDMCRRYLAIAQVDMDTSLDKASPVLGWSL